MDAVKVLHSICEKIWKTQHWPQDWIRSVSILIPKKGNAKECSNYCTDFTYQQGYAQNPSGQASAVYKLRTSRCTSWILKRPRKQFANICWIMEKAKEFQENTDFYFTDCAKTLTVWITTICGKFFKRWQFQTS